MHLCSGRSMAAVSVAIVLRHANGFIVPMRGGIRHLAPAVVGGASKVQSWTMSTRAPSPPARVSGVPIFNPDAVELKAERLWGMADATKSVPNQNDEVAGSTTQTSPRLSLEEGLGDRDTFVEEEREVSAMRRYEYSAMDCDDGGDDEREYYI